MGCSFCSAIRAAILPTDRELVHGSCLAALLEPRSRSFADVLDHPVSQLAPRLATWWSQHTKIEGGRSPQTSGPAPNCPGAQDGLPRRRCNTQFARSRGCLAVQGEGIFRRPPLHSPVLVFFFFRSPAFEEEYEPPDEKGCRISLWRARGSCGLRKTQDQHCWGADVLRRAAPLAPVFSLPRFSPQ